MRGRRSPPRRPKRPPPLPSKTRDKRQETGDERQEHETRGKRRVSCLLSPVSRLLSLVSLFGEWPRLCEAGVVQFNFHSSFIHVGPHRPSAEAAATPPKT